MDRWGNIQKVITSFLILTFLSVQSGFAKDKWVSTDKPVLDLIQSNGLLGKDVAGLKIKQITKELYMVRLGEAEREKLSALVHEHLHRCGGFLVLEDAEAKAIYSGEQELYNKGKPFFNVKYSMDRSSQVASAQAEIRESNIRAVIKKLSSYKNRYYKSETGVQAAKWIRDKWAELVASRSDAKVELFEHSSWSQNSVILTIEGSTNPDEVVVIGGHLDSIAGFWNRASATAPGADDNASGMATITEVIRSLVASQYRPERTLKFMGYAAEELGLLGSKEIARDHKRRGVNVVGVLQFDMTNYNGSDRDIYLITDNTNDAQNKFVGQLIDEYVSDVAWGNSTCGYACSDHASWNQNGFRASFPFEADSSERNRRIHTARDTLEVSGGTADHANKFARLGVAFAIEMAK